MVLKSRDVEPSSTSTSAAFSLCSRGRGVNKLKVHLPEAISAKSEVCNVL